MNEITLNFTFYGGDEMPDMDNDVIYILRKEVSEMMNRAGFGEVSLLPNDRFQNRFAIPVVDVYHQPENDLFISFNWHLPLLAGNLGAVLNEGVPYLQDVVNTIHHDLHLLLRVIIN